jgi:hypothetical protein
MMLADGDQYEMIIVFILLRLWITLHELLL